MAVADVILGTIFARPEKITFTEWDPEDKEHYTHSFTIQEMMDFIEINYLLTREEKNRTRYKWKWGREFLEEYYLYTRHGVENAEYPFIRKCLETLGFSGVILEAP